MDLLLSTHIWDGCKYRCYSITVRTSLTKMIAVFFPQFGRYSSSTDWSFFSDVCAKNRRWLICLILSIQHRMGIASMWVNTASAGRIVTREAALRGIYAHKPHHEGNAPNPLSLCPISTELNGNSCCISQTIRRGCVVSEWRWWRSCCFPSCLNIQIQFCSSCVL